MKRKERTGTADEVQCARQTLSRPHGKDAKIVEAAGLPKKARKSVFRPILASPFTVDWPTTSASDSTTILHSLLELLRIPDVQGTFKRIKHDIPRSSASRTKEKARRRKARLLLATLSRQGIVPTFAVEGPAFTTTGECERASVCGLNGVTRLLEGCIADRAQRLAHHKPSTIFVCQSDVSPADILSHLPMLVATHNALCDGRTRLVRLPSGSQQALSECVNLRRCSVLSLDFEALRRRSDSDVTRAVDALDDLLNRCHVSEARMPWLEQATSASTIKLLPPRIKHVHSSAPIDLNSVKAEKKERRAERKALKHVH